MTPDPTGPYRFPRPFSAGLPFASQAAAFRPLLRRLPRKGASPDSMRRVEAALRAALEATADRRAKDGPAWKLWAQAAFRS
jgi:hypothetical protein